MTVGGAARVIRVYGAWIVLVTAVVVAAAVAISMMAPRQYRSEAIVVVEAQVRANTAPVPPDMGTEKEIARSGLVLDPAARGIGEDPAALLAGLTVSVAPDGNVLTFTVTNADPAVAQRHAEALATAYVSFRNSGEISTAAPTSAAATNSTLHTTLVTDAAFGTPVDRSIWINVGLGLAVGLLLGVGTALVRDRMSDRIRGRDDFERVSQATVLATVPRARVPRGTDVDRPVLLRAPESATAESFRYLRSRLQPLVQTGAAVLVTSAGEREGRTATATNLAIALAQSGTEVILIDADLRNPRVHVALGADNTVGLTSVLAGEKGAADALRDTAVPGLRMLTAGPPAGNAADLLGGKRLRRVLDALRGQCDILVLDSAPVLHASETIVAAAACDHILLVADYRRTTRGYVTRALDELGEVVHGNVSGVLLNAPRIAGGLSPQGRLPQADALPIPDDATDQPAATGARPAPVVNGSARVPVVTVPPPAPVVNGSAPAPVVNGSAPVPVANGSAPVPVPVANGSAPVPVVNVPAPVPVVNVPAPVPAEDEGAPQPSSTVYGSARVPTVYSSASASSVPAIPGYDRDDLKHPSGADLPVQRGDLRRRLSRRASPPGRAGGGGNRA